MAPTLCSVYQVDVVSKETDGMTTLYAAEKKALRIGPDAVYPSGKYATLLREQENGIGAQDDDMVGIIEWGHVEAGGAYAAAIRGANEMRRKAAEFIYGDFLPETSWAVPRG